MRLGVFLLGCVKSIFSKRFGVDGSRAVADFGPFFGFGVIVSVLTKTPKIKYQKKLIYRSACISAACDYCQF